jgi:MFS family permease
VPPTDDHPAATGPRAAFGLIASRRFGPYFVGNALSAMGVWFHNLAAALLIFRETGSEFLLGMLAASQFLPTLLLVSVAGSVADRYDRQRVVLVSQLAAMGFAVAVAVLAFADALPVWLVLVLSLGMGIATAFTAPASGALVPALVEQRDLGSAVALNSMTYNLARALGPALAALVVTTLGLPAAFAVNAASYLALSIGVMVVTPPRRIARTAGSKRLRDTLALIRDEPRLGVYLVIVMIVGFASDPINTLAPAFAHELGRPDTDAGLLIGMFGAGAVLAALVMTGRVAASRRRLGVTLTVLGASVALFSLAPSLGLALVLLVVAGFAYLSGNSGTTSRLQLEVADEQRGRIMALWAVAFLGLRPLASLVDGALASAFGVRVAGVVLALPALAAGIALLTPAVRLRRRQPA